MTDDPRLRIAIPYLLMVTLGLMVILLPVWARTLGILGAVVGSCGLVWACWGTGISGKVLRRISRQRVRNASSEPHAEEIDRWLRHMIREQASSAPSTVSTEEIGPIDAADASGEWIVVAVPCKKEIYDEMTQAVAGGLRLAQMPGLEKPSEL